MPNRPPEGEVGELPVGADVVVPVEVGHERSKPNKAAGRFTPEFFMVVSWVRAWSRAGAGRSAFP